MNKSIKGFATALDSDIPVPVEKPNLLELINTATEDELLVIQDIIKERFEADNRIAKIPDLANSEFSVFDSRKVEKISDKVIEIRRRRYTTFVYYYSHYDRTDDQMVQFIQMCNPSLSYIEAVRDLSNIKLVIGNFPRARKELIRFQVTEMHKKAYQKALEKNDPIAMTMAGNNITKAHALDKGDIDIPWEQMMIPDWEPTDDITSFDETMEQKTQRELDEQIAKMRKRYMPEVTDVEPL